MPLQVRRGTTAERGTITPLVGELIYDTQEGKLYVGDGTTAGGVPASAYSDDDAQDAVFTALNHSDHTGISFTYNDTANKITAIVNPDLTNYEGVIGADGFKGSIFADDSTLIFNAATGTVSANFRGDLMGSVFADNSTILIDGVLAAFNLDGTVRTNVIPAVNEVYDLGSSGARFKDIYLSGTSIFLGNATITATGSAVNLPVGSTVGGVPIGSGSGTGDGVVAGSNYNINIVGDDSTLIVNVASKVLTGSLVGNVTGNVTGNLDGFVLGQRSGVPGQTLLNNSTSTLDINNIDCDFVTAIQMNAETIFSSLVGDVKGSVFADDSGVMIDAIDRKIYGDLEGLVIGQRSGVPGQTLLDNVSSTLDINNVNCDFVTATQINATTINSGTVVGIITGSPGSSMVGDVIGNTQGYHEGPVKGSIFADNSAVLVESDTGRHYGTFVGNVIGNVLGDMSGNVFGTLLGNVTGNVTGDLIGNVTGDLMGSVFADDSSIIIDATNRTFNNGNIVISEGNLTSITDGIITFRDTQVVINSFKDPGTGDLPRIRFEAHRLSGGALSVVQNTDVIVTIVGTGYNGTDYVTAGSVNFVVNDASISGASTFIRTDTYIGDNFELTSLSGNYLKIDKVGITTAPAFVTGSYATGGEPSGPVAGMIIFDSTTQKYKGYVNDTGLAGGGPSNSTPGWVDLY